MKDNQKLNLTPSQEARYNNITYIAASIGIVGSIAGVIYSKRTGGGFWRGVGYWFLGGMVTGIPARLVAVPFQNKILKESENKHESKTE